MQCTSLNMQRKPGFPVANCSIKMPDGLGFPETGAYEEENEQQQKRQQLINFGHAQWGFNNWNWAVTKQELDFVELTNGKYCAGVVAFVSVSVKSFDLHRENIGYATSNANTKGFAIYKSRKCAVTNALRETLLSFGGSVATELLELLESQRSDLPTPVPLAPASVPLAPAPVPLAPIPVPLAPAPIPEPLSENNQNIANKNDIKNVKNSNGRKESIDNTAHNMRPHPVKNAAANAPRSPPVARAHPMPSTLPPANRPLAGPPRPAAPHPRPNPNDGKIEGMTEEEARAERKRRQRLAQEDFRQKQLSKHGTDDKQESTKNSSSLDELLMEIPTQDIVIQETGDSAARPDKRRSPAAGGCAKRRASLSKLDIVQTD